MPRSLSVFSVIALPIIVPYFGLLSTHAYPAIALVTIISPLLTAPTTLHGTRPDNAIPVTKSPSKSLLSVLD